MAFLNTTREMTRQTCNSPARSPARRVFRGLAGFAGLLALFALAASPALPGNVRVPEYEAKAAFLYNFFRFVDWPEGVFDDETDPFRIGVLGVDPFGRYLDNAVRDRTIDGRAIEVVRYSRLGDIEGVHLLFVSESERDELPAIMERLASRPILTVGDVDGFAAHGGMVEFFFRSQRVAFRINHTAAQRAGLSMSARLLSLAVLVEES